MKKILLIATCLMVFTLAKAQTDSATEKKQKTFATSITTMDSKIIKGTLSSVNDSQLVLKTYKNQMAVPAENVKSFTIKRKNSALKGALIGFGIGAAAGIIIGLASGNDPVMSYPDPSEDPFGLGSFGVAMNNAFAMTAGQKAVAGGIALGGTGAIVGTIIGAVARKKFIIGGRKEKFHDLQGELMMKLVKK
jgi:hypothetical protein